MLLIQHMCCYFGNIELDRDDAGFARLDPNEKVDWWDTLGNEIEVSPEERANDWACDLLLPDRMLSDDIQEKPVTFDTVRELASRYRTDVAPAAIRLVASANGDAMLVRSRPGEASKCLQSNGVSIDFWLREEPGPGTVAHDLLRGSREAPGPREVLLDGWFKPEPAWWFTVQEDSIAMPGGEVFSILWWEEDGYEALLKFKDDLATEPGEEAVRQLVAGVVKGCG